MNGCVLYGAPMAGITDKPFRQICRQFTDMPLYTEMIGVNSFMRGASATKRMMNLSSEKNIIVQLVGIDTEALAYTAKAAEDAGAVGVDLNMGCPVKKLITNGSGAALMKNATLAAKLVETVAEAVQIPVSVKMRLGWAQKEEGLPFAKTMVEAGAKRIAVHARTKAQGFSGQADWESARVLAAHISNAELIINGDVADKASLQAAQELSGMQNVMIGRGAWGKPWLFSALAGEEVPSRAVADIAAEHFEQMLAFYGKAGLYAARKHLARYAKGFEGHALFCAQMFKEETPAEVLRLIRLFFGAETTKEKK